MTIARPAVYLDRDGVLTEPVWNPRTGEYESPHAVADLVMCPAIVAPLRQLRERGHALVMVSNQPSYAKGKVALATLQAIAAEVERFFRQAGIDFAEVCYCYHHPRGILPGVSGPCPCRKPSPHVVRRVAERHGFDLARSWMIGDRDTDIDCGRRAGCRTALVRHRHAGGHQGRSQPTLVADDLAGAVAAILAGDVAVARTAGA